MDTFETGTVMNEETLREIKHHLITRGRKIAILVIILMAAGVLVMAIAIQSVPLICTAAVAVVLFILEYFFIVNRNIKVFLKKVEETAHTREYRYTTAFTEAGMQIVNHTTGSNSLILYSDIKGVRETRRHYMVFTRANQFTLLDRAALDGAGKTGALKAMLHSRAPGILWK